MKDIHLVTTSTVADCRFINWGRSDFAPQHNVRVSDFSVYSPSCTHSSVVNCDSTSACAANLFLVILRAAPFSVILKRLIRELSLNGIFVYR